MGISVSKSDIIWGYIAIFFQVASGIIILPFILRFLNADEVGYNYLMLTIGQMVALFDAGFSPMFGKNISYIFSGATELKKEGVIESKSDQINYHLLATMIVVARHVYRKMSVIVLALLLTGGTVYTYHVTNGYASVNNAFVIWLIYSASTFFNIYYSYFNALLLGSGQIKESKKAMIISRLLYIVLSISFLYLGVGLMGVCIANLIAPFANRYLCYRSFFIPSLRSKLSCEEVNKLERKNTFDIIWYNARKMCIGSIGSYCINRSSLFLAGLFLPLPIVGSYGLMLQLGGIISSISINYFMTVQPRMAYYKIKGDLDMLKKEFSFAIVVFYILAICGFAMMIFIAQYALQIIHSQTTLPSVMTMSLFALVSILETNHSLCATLITVGNRVPPIAASLLPGFFIVFFSWLFLKFTNLQILGLVIAQGICQLAYNNWKWPMEALKDLKMTIADVFWYGSNILFAKVKNVMLCGTRCVM